MATYKGKKVTVREITAGDPGYDQANPKVEVTKEDGSKETVNKSDVSQ